MAESKYGKYVVTDLIVPEEKKIIAADYAKYAKRILWMDSNVCEGAFQMNTAWYFAVPPRDPIFTEHDHDHGENDQLHDDELYSHDFLFV